MALSQIRIGNENFIAADVIGLKVYITKDEYFDTVEEAAEFYDTYLKEIVEPVVHKKMVNGFIRKYFPISRITKSYSYDKNKILSLFNSRSWIGAPFFVNEDDTFIILENDKFLIAEG
jgi:hypothetical protein